MKTLDLGPQPPPQGRMSLGGGLEPHDPVNQGRITSTVRDSTQIDSLEPHSVKPSAQPRNYPID